MANYCDNTLDFTCKELPEWLKKDPENGSGITLENYDDRYLSLYNDFDTIMADNTHGHIINEDGTHRFQFGFETKWCPPEKLYELMMEDENIIEFEAIFFEPGCGVLGFANKDGMNYEDCPDRFYSDMFDMDVMKEEPPQCYIDINGTDYILLDKYLEDIKATQLTKEQQDEVNEIKDFFDLEL